MTLCAHAQRVVLDFTAGTAWTALTATAYTDGEHEIEVAGDHQFHTNGFLLLKAGSSLTLPDFGFKVRRLTVCGAKGGSSGVVFNVFDEGGEAVSSPCTGSNYAIRTFDIDPDRRDPAMRYSLRATTNHELRITNICVYEDETPTYDGPFHALVAEKDGIFYAATNKVGSNGWLEVEAVSVVQGYVDTDKASLRWIVKDCDGQATIQTPGMEFLAYKDGNTFAALGSEPYAWECDASTFATADGSRKIMLSPIYDYMVCSGEGFAAKALVIGVPAHIDGCSPTPSATVHDLAGRITARPSKGVYIVNGKRVMVK